MWIAANTRWVRAATRPRAIQPRKLVDALPVRHASRTAGRWTGRRAGTDSGGEAAGQAAQERSGDEPEAERGIHVSETPRPRVRARDVGDVAGGGHGQIGTRHPGEHPPEIEDRQERRQPHDLLIEITFRDVGIFGGHSDF